MTTLNLYHFCNPSDLRPYCRDPFTLNGLTVATNGHVLLFAPFDQDIVTAEQLASKSPISLQTIYDTIQAATFKPMPLLLDIKTITCEDCEGTGKSARVKCIECDGDGEIVYDNGHHRYDWDCEMCEGAGYTVITNSQAECQSCYGKGKHAMFLSGQTMEGIRFQNSYLSLILDLPELVYSIIELGSNKALAFKNSMYSGLIMQLRV